MYSIFSRCIYTSVQLLIRGRLSVTSRTVACQASLSITNSQSLLKLTSIESVMPSSHLILLSPSPSAFNLSQHLGLFQWVSSLHQVTKVLEFQLQHQSFQWIFQWIFRIDWLDLLAVQGTIKSLNTNAIQKLCDRKHLDCSYKTYKMHCILD